MSFKLNNLIRIFVKLRYYIESFDILFRKIYIGEIFALANSLLAYYI